MRHMDHAARVETSSPAGLGLPAPQFRIGLLSQLEVIGQSVASVAPTLTPAINISVVAGLAGVGSWVSFLIASITMMFVAASIGSLARRHPLAGSYFVYIGRTFGPTAGSAAGWSMICAYLGTAVAIALSSSIFVKDMLDAFGLARLSPPGWMATVCTVAMAWIAARRDIRISSRAGLVVEAISVSLIALITAVVVVRSGRLLDYAQLDPPSLVPSGILSGLTFAVFCFVGFESAATLAKETRDAPRMIPIAVMLSTLGVGLFFVGIAYSMVLAVGDDAGMIGDSSSPLTEITRRAGLPWAAGIVYASACMSSFACVLAMVNAAARIIFSMGRFGFLGRSVGVVHTLHRTPHVAVTLSCAFTLLACIALLPLGALAAFSYAGTFGTFGFLVVYLLICIASPVDLRRAGAMRVRHAIIGAVGAFLMLVVIFGGLVPMPPWPSNLIPYLFASFVVSGMAWSRFLRSRDSAALMGFDHDPEV